MKIKIRSNVTNMKHDGTYIGVLRCVYTNHVGQFKSLYSSPKDMDNYVYNYYDRDYALNEVDNAQNRVQKCHMHNKHQNGCKFCISYKQSLNKNKESNENSYQNLEKTESSYNSANAISNINPILRNNIISSEYYKKIAQYDTLDEVLQEIYAHADHAQPFCSLNSMKPSTLFCCLYKLITMNLDDESLKLLIEDTTSPYAKCCGFLYIRYLFHYNKLYKWFKPYLLDIQEFTTDLAKSKTVTLGDYLHSLLMDDKYFNTVLPRLPVKFKDSCVPEILELEEFRKCKIKNLKNLEQFREGSEVEYFDGDKWHFGTIEAVNSKGGLTTVSVTGRDGSTQVVDLSSIKLRYLDNKRSREYDKRRERSRSRERGYKSDRYEEYKERERERVVAQGKDYSKRPRSFKSSLSQRSYIRN